MFFTRLSSITGRKTPQPHQQLSFWMISLSITISVLLSPTSIPSLQTHFFPNLINPSRLQARSYPLLGVPLRQKGLNYPVHRLLDREPRHKSHQASLPVETPQPQSAPLFEVVPVGRRTLESWRVCAEGMEQGLHLPPPPPNCWRLLVSARLWALIYCPTGSNGGKKDAFVSFPLHSVPFSSIFL